MTDDLTPMSHGERVPNSDEFEAAREEWRASLAADSDLRAEAISLQVAAEKHRYTYTWDWLGVPIIRLPDDVCTLQELVWSYRPTAIVETGIARGGSLLLNASLQRLTGISPRVLGIDLQIFDHTHSILAEHPLASGIEILEADSTSVQASDHAAAFLEGAERAILVLDSNHAHKHVLAELRSLATLLPVGGYVLVADTLIEEFPPGHFADRPWDRGNNPLTATRQFLAERDNFEVSSRWSRRGLMSEFRDGVLRRNL